MIKIGFYMIGNIITNVSFSLRHINAHHMGENKININNISTKTKLRITLGGIILLAIGNILGFYLHYLNDIVEWRLRLFGLLRVLILLLLISLIFQYTKYNKEFEQEIIDTI